MLGPWINPISFGQHAPFWLSCCWDWVRMGRDLIDTVALSTAPSHPLLFLVYSWPGAWNVPPIPLLRAALVPALEAHSQTYSAWVSAPVWKRKSSQDQASPRTKINILELREIGASFNEPSQSSTCPPPPASQGEDPEHQQELGPQVGVRASLPRLLCFLRARGHPKFYCIP